MAIRFHEYDDETDELEQIGTIEDGEIVDGEEELTFLKGRGISLSDEQVLNKAFDGPYLFAVKGDSLLTGKITEKDWQPYEGPRGGDGWYNPETDEVRYDEKPGEGESSGNDEGDNQTVAWQDPPEDIGEYELGQRVEFATYSDSGTGYINDITETGDGGILSIESQEHGSFDYNLAGENAGVELTGVADAESFDDPGDSDGTGGEDVTGGQSTADESAAERDETDGGDAEATVDVDVVKASPEEFANAVSTFMENNPEMGAFLTEHSPEELEDHTILTSEDGNAGVSVSPEGDIQNLFSGNEAPEGTGRELIEQAIDEGGRTLDCYDGFLPDLYSEYNFNETGRIEFNPDYAPENWNFEEYGQPDVVFMAYQPESEYEQTEEYYEANEWDDAKQDSRRTANTQSSSGEKGRGVRGEARGPDSATGKTSRGTVTDNDALVDKILATIDTDGDE